MTVILNVHGSQGSMTDIVISSAVPRVGDVLSNRNRWNFVVEKVVWHVESGPIGSIDDQITSADIYLRRIEATV